MALRRKSDMTTGDEPVTLEDAWDRGGLAHKRITQAENHIEAIDHAFVKNDLGEPDYDGHRRAHAESIEHARMMQTYKSGIATKLGGWLAIGVVSAIGALALDWIKDHLK